MPSKSFSSKRSVIIFSIIVILGIVGFIIAQSQISNYEEEAIQREVALKKEVERQLFDLRQVLISNVDKETKTSRSLEILGNIRATLDREYAFLRLEAQQKVNILYGRIDEIEDAVINDLDSALALVDALIDDLQSSDDLGSFGENDSDNNESDSNGSNSSDYNPDYSDDTDDNNQNDDTTDQIQSDESGLQGEEPIIYVEDNEDDDTTYYKSGVLPKVDRDRSEEQQDENFIDFQVGN